MLSSSKSIIHSNLLLKSAVPSVANIKLCYSTAVGEVSTTSENVEKFSKKKLRHPVPRTDFTDYKIFKAERKKAAKERKEKNILKGMIKAKTFKNKCDPVFGSGERTFFIRLEAYLQNMNTLLGGFTEKDIEKALLLQEILQKEENTKLKKANEEYSENLLATQSELSDIQNADVVDSQVLELENEMGNLSVSENKNERELTTELIAKKDAIMKILTVKNASNSEKLNLAIEFAKKEFQRHDRDTSSGEVLTGILTTKIHFLAEHCKRYPKEKRAFINLNNLVQQRQRALRHLKASQPERYFFAITKIGLNDAAVFDEFHLSREYMQEFEFFGSNTDVHHKTASEKRLQFKHKLLYNRYPDYVEELKKKYGVDDLTVMPDKKRS
ncbi:hypothetical protein QEN19_001235 [Hanseniaspora menglaensis]